MKLRRWASSSVAARSAAVGLLTLGLVGLAVPTGLLDGEESGAPGRQAAPAATGQADPSVASAVAQADDVAEQELDVDLSDQVRDLGLPVDSLAGADALRALGGPDGADLSAVAAAHRMTAANLAASLTRDASLNINAEGRLFYADTLDSTQAEGHGSAHDAVPEPAHDDGSQRGDADSTPLPQAFSSSGTPYEADPGFEEYPLDDTFRLHSRPDSPRTIYLDMDGHTFQPHDGWDKLVGHTYCGWDLADDGPEFNPYERRQVQRVWKEVAAHYDAFDVNVTTQDPGADAILWSGASDTRFGNRVVIAGDSAIIQGLPPSPWCGSSGFSGTVGLGYIDHFATRSYAASLALPIANLGWVINHEVGHVVGLEHTFQRLGGADGTDLARTMNYNVSGPIITFSQQERLHALKHFWRPGAEGSSARTQFLPSIRNDMASAEPLRPGAQVDAVLNVATPMPVGSRDDANGYPSQRVTGLEPRGDRDWYSLEQCSTIQARVRPLKAYSHLDLSLSLVDADGTVIAKDAPASGGALGNGVVAGTAASLRGVVEAEGPLYLVVAAASSAEGGEDPADLRNVGGVRPSGHHSGTYRLELDVCDETQAAPPIRVRADTAPSGEITVEWQEPLLLGDASGAVPAGITGYEVALDGRRSVTVDADSLSHVFPVTPNAHRARVRAVYGSLTSDWTSTEAFGTAPIAPVSIRVPTTPGSQSYEIVHDSRWIAQMNAWTADTMPRVRFHFINDADGKSYNYSLGAVAYAQTFVGDYLPRPGSTSTVEVARPGYASAFIEYTVPVFPADAETPLAAPTDLRLESTTTSTRVRWTPPGPRRVEVTEYRLSVGGESRLLEGDATNFELPDAWLTSGAVAPGSRVLLTARAGGGQQSATEITVPAAALAGKPTGVEIREGAAETSLRWDRYTQAPVTGDLTGWQVRIGARTVNLSASATSINLTGFRAERELAVTLAPVNGVGVGEARTVRLAPGVG